MKAKAGKENADKEKAGNENVKAKAGKENVTAKAGKEKGEEKKRSAV